jgi:hypothetical protein
VVDDAAGNLKILLQFCMTLTKGGKDMDGTEGGGGGGAVVGGLEEMNVRKAAHNALCYKRTKRHRHAAAAAAGHGDRHHVITLVLIKSCRIDIVLQKSNSLISVSGGID